ncbi:flagellar hook-length control protein FliK [Brevundimonas sp. FT23042]|uniref:flagellar hook-length control protein FliK n=1 Tax=Brevundimonas sp. FT23042 TaxID=3393749 RepID=UPI003B5896E8
MSTASALLNMIAPAAPTPSQATAPVDASVFGGLLSALAGGETDELPPPEATLDATLDATGSSAQAFAVAPAASQPRTPILPSLALRAGANLSIVIDEAPAETPVPTADIPTVEPSAPAPQVQPDLSSATAKATENEDATEPAVPAQTVAAPLVQPLVQPAAPTGPAGALAGTSAQPQVQPPLPPAPTAADKDADAPLVHPTAEPVPAAKSVDAGPDVRPAIKPDPIDDAQVQPRVDSGSDRKAATPEPLVRPAAEQSYRPRETVSARMTGRTEAVDRLQTLTAEQPIPETSPALEDPARPSDKPLAAAPLTQPPANAPAPAATAVRVLPREAPQPAATTEVRPVTSEDEPLTPAAGTAISEAEAVPVTTDAREAAAAPPEAPRPAEAPRLRALSERAAAAGTNAAVDSAAPLTPTSTGAAVSVTTATVADAQGSPASPKTAVEAPALEIADAAPDAATEAPIDATAPEATPSAQTAHAAREALSPTQSRVAIEATAQIAAQILKKLDGRSTRFEMSLTPDELGRVDVKLDIDAEGRLAARLAFDNPAAATDLKGRVDDLRRQLEQQGFQLTEDSFEFTQRDSGSSAFDRGQDSRQGQSRAFAAAARLNTEADAIAQPPRWQSLSLTPAGVDMKV